MGEEGQTTGTPDKLDRRRFLELAATSAGVMFMKPELAFGTAANSAVRVGLLGCGGRGTEDASNLVDTGGARVVAGHDPLVAERFGGRAGSDNVIQVSP